MFSRKWRNEGFEKTSFQLIDVYLPRSANGKPSWLCALRAKLYFIYLAGGEMRPSRDPIEKIVECCVTFDYTLRVHHVNLVSWSELIQTSFSLPPPSLYKSNSEGILSCQNTISTEQKTNKLFGNIFYHFIWRLYLPMSVLTWLSNRSRALGPSDLLAR